MFTIAVFGPCELGSGLSLTAESGDRFVQVKAVLTLQWIPYQLNLHMLRGLAPASTPPL